MTGLRYNEGKLRWGLLSWPAIGELVKVLMIGAKKYSSWNWAGGLSWTETFESMQRHSVLWYQGEDKDPETGLSHMAHAFCNAMFLLHFIIMRAGTDDRPTALRYKDLQQKEKKEYYDTTSYPVGPVSGVSNLQENIQPAPQQGELFDSECYRCGCPTPIGWDRED